MVITRTELDRLALLLQRMLDAELLLDAEGARLLTETEAARQSLEEGNTEAARQHIEQIARFTEALVQARALTPADGQAVLQTVNGILNPVTDAGDATR